MAKKCVEIKIRGTVQGVGFRPFVYRLAKGLGIKGKVSNTERGVLIMAEADESVLTGFIKAIETQCPPLSVIKSLEVSQLTLETEHNDFQIVKSQKAGTVSTEIPPDIATCDDCLKEINDPHDRRFGYAFTNCTNCGPRYTIIKALPYDRPATSMKSFVMCEMCQAEYHNPMDRRFHAQPNACPDCGPHLFFVDNSGNRHDKAPLSIAIGLLQEEKIVAIKGLGGFHLACSAFSVKAIACLRERKNRPFKPLAIMARDMDVAKRIGIFSKDSERAINSFRAPIVLVPKAADNLSSSLVAPNIQDIGVMLPYTPLHHLLFQTPGCPEALVMTSGNPKDEPLCTSNQEAIDRLGNFVDGFLLHNRDIFTGVDDSVLKDTSMGNIFIRRSRGYAPSPIEFPHEYQGILGAGAHLKNTFCLTKPGSVYLSQHIGNLVTGPTYDFYKKNIAHLSKLLEIEIRACACDLHPDYLSSRFCMESGLPIVKVQHHFAHAASVMAEHNLRGPSIAICLDGTGFGTDGTVWGGEVLFCTPRGFKRLARLRPFPLPGGDACAKAPWRSALSLLCEAFGPDHPLPDTLRQLNGQRLDFVRQMILKGINSPWSSSCGRLFDAVAALCGQCLHNTFEAQAAMELEGLCQKTLRGSLITNTDWFESFLKNDRLIRKKGNLLELDWQVLIKEIQAPETWQRQDFSMIFHSFIVAGFAKMAISCCQEFGIDNVIFTGGCMQNRILLEGFADFFKKNGIDYFTNEMVPANDGGLCLGQAFVAVNMMYDG